MASSAGQRLTDLLALSVTVLPYLVAKGWGMVAMGFGGRAGSGALFTRKFRRSERQSVMEQTQIT